MNFCASIFNIKSLLSINLSTPFLQWVFGIVLLQVRFLLIESRFVTTDVGILSGNVLVKSEVAWKEHGGVLRYRHFEWCMVPGLPY